MVTRYAAIITGLALALAGCPEETGDAGKSPSGTTDASGTGAGDAAGLGDVGSGGTGDAGAVPDPGVSLDVGGTSDGNLPDSGPTADVTVPLDGCSPSCTGRQCGDDGCGGSCGTCSAGELCDASGQCMFECVPKCEGKVCGDDGCTGSCGTCGPGLSCDAAGKCVVGCTADCTGKVCGSDGCGGTCGTCAAGQVCDQGGQCQACTAQCTGKVCGDDGCGGSCGTCAAGQSCDATGQCVQCTPQCTGKVCGSDGCEGTCGSCGAGQTCSAAGQCVGGPGDGETCDAPLVVNVIPFSYSGSTAGHTDDYETGGGCGSEPGDGAGVPDVAFVFTPTVTGVYSMGLDPYPDTPMPTTITAVTSCSAVAATCLGFSGDLYGSFNDDTLDVFLTAGETYYLIIDGLYTSDAGGFTFTVSAPCIPSCDGKQCGGDGCGTVCGTCTVEEVCTATQQCESVATVPGNTCSNPLTVGALPFSGQSSTADATPVYSAPANACPGMSSARGSASNDHVWSFTPALSGVYTVAVDAEFDSAIYVVTDCANIAATCVQGVDDGNPETMLVSLEAGVTVFIVVDGWSNSTNIKGAYTLTVSDPCIPQCDGKTCGQNGCGGTCGTCADGEFCVNDGTCVEAAAAGGDTCADPLVIDSIPYVVTADTSYGSNDYSFGDDVCPGQSTGRGAGSRDHVFRVTPPLSGLYTFSVDADFDSALYVVSDCADVAATCVGAVDDGNPEELSVSLQAGTSYYLIVDGWSNSSDLKGPYTLTVKPPCLAKCQDKECGDDGCGGTCGNCAAGSFCDPDQLCTLEADIVGNVCANPFVIGALPFEGTGDTSDASPSVTGPASCPGLSSSKGAASKDEVWAFTPPSDGVYTIALNGAFDSALYVLEGCGDGAICRAGSEGSGVETVTVALTGGTTYYVVADGWSNSSDVHGTYTLTVSEPCLPQCDLAACDVSDGCGGDCGCVPGEKCVELACVPEEPGDSCATAFVIDTATLPTTLYGDTTQATAAVSIAAESCPGISGSKGAASNDHVWALVPTVSGIYTLTAKGDFDLALYVITDCASASQTCIGGSESSTTSAEVVDVALEAGATYYVVVDGYSDSVNKAGIYQVTVSKPCIPSCDGKECGTNGCGGTCGTCLAGDLCQPDGICAAASTVTGNTCINPFVVGALPFTAESTTQNATPVYGYAAGVCPGVTGARGSASNDHVYAFTPTVGGVYTVELDAAFDSTLYVVTDCSDIGSTCTAASDSGNPETVALPTVAGTTYYVVVDGWSTSSNVQGIYALSIDGPCTPQCDGKTCGPDGCGATCGTCPTGDFCDTTAGECVAGDSCQGRCGDYDSSAACQCDSSCFSFFDCCDDICTQCSANFPGDCL